MTTHNAPSTIDARAARLVQQMTLDEKIQIVSGLVGIPVGDDGTVQGELPIPFPPELVPGPGAVGSDGYVPGIDRLGIPALQLVGAGVGVTDQVRRPGGAATVFPSPMGQTATWDPELSYAFGAALAREIRAQGCNVALAGAANLALEPRSGRVFEYHGEDPVLAGTMVAAELRGTQDEGVVATIKHFAANFQETGRHVLSAQADERSLRQGELLAFEIGITTSGVGAVMASYNRINGTYASEHSTLLTEILKQDWDFEGWVMSDWGGTHSTAAAAVAGLDQEFPLNKERHFGPRLKRAVEDGEVSVERLDDMCHRILRSLIDVGLIDSSPKSPPDTTDSIEIAGRIADASIVLLRNEGALLPLDADVLASIAVIGGHADVAVLSGGGSSAINPIGGDPVTDPNASFELFGRQVWVPSSPLDAIAVAAPGATTTFSTGDDVVAAAEAARTADVAIVFATQWTSEGSDVEDLALPHEQNELITAVVEANPRTIVVLETGGAILMPWADQVPAVLEAWYPGHGGGPAVARVLFGVASPSAKLPISFPRSVDDLPHPQLTGPSAFDDEGTPMPFDVTYDAGLAIGYKWFDTRGIEPAFCFGHGLSYTNFEYSDLVVSLDNSAVAVSFTLANTGGRVGSEIAQVYVSLPVGLGEPPWRLVAWAKRDLQPGRTERIALDVPLRRLSIWDVDASRWRVPDGEFFVRVGASSRDVRLQDGVIVDGSRW